MVQVGSEVVDVTKKVGYHVPDSTVAETSVARQFLQVCAQLWDKSLVFLVQQCLDESQHGIARYAAAHLSTSSAAKGTERV